ncbi:MAG: hypothetical protein PHQ59_00800 [Candidatus Daviesbacteria bacterium]|nr:hypothetical protein [Candidatus Daviesbacteria bacterium]
MNKKVLIILLPFVVVIIGLAALLLFPKKSQITPTVISSLTPTPTQTAILKPLVVKPPTDQELGLVSVVPSPDPTGQNKISPIERITFTFNKSVDPTTLEFNSQPEVELEKYFSENNTKLLIQPQGLAFWKPNTDYVLTIRKQLRSKDGFSLKEDIMYNLKAITQGGE